MQELEDKTLGYNEPEVNTGRGEDFDDEIIDDDDEGIEGSGEREGYILKPSPEYVKDVFLKKKPFLRTSKNGNLTLVFEFGKQDGGRFEFIVTNFFKLDTKIKGLRKTQVSHLIQALMIDPYEKINDRLTKPRYSSFVMKGVTLEKYFNHLISCVSDEALEVPYTLKLVYNGTKVDFPLVPSFIASPFNGIDPAKSFEINPQYDKMTKTVPDSEGGSGAKGGSGANDYV